MLDISSAAYGNPTQLSGVRTTAGTYSRRPFLVLFAMSKTLPDLGAFSPQPTRRGFCARAKYGSPTQVSTLRESDAGNSRRYLLVLPALPQERSDPTLTLEIEHEAFDVVS